MKKDQQRRRKDNEGRRGRRRDPCLGEPMKKASLEGRDDGLTEQLYIQKKVSHECICIKR